MPYQNPCPKCAKVGLVRAERIIQGHRFSFDHYCGYCEHQWTVVDVEHTVSAPQKYPPYPKPRTRSFGPKRRGN